ncbi:unnamed protein product [Sphagnum jensenii]|uniref:Uncharacterized protein n=1 Tax=Sphagnum jensenii TaxID=128206 RepID=A0ABP1B112_9BRYO
MQGSRYTHSLFWRGVEKVIVIKSATSKCDPSRQARPQLISTKILAPNAAVSRWKMAPSCDDEESSSGSLIQKPLHWVF